MIEFSNYDILRNLLVATQWTILLSLAAFIGGVSVALCMTAARLTKNPALTGLIKCYVEVFQGTPLLMQMFLCFFGLSLVGINISAWNAAALSLTLFTSAFLVEIWRGCIDTLPKGQWEASRCLGLSFLQTLRYVVSATSLQSGACSVYRLFSTGRQRHRFSVCHRLCGANQSRHHAQ